MNPRICATLILTFVLSACANEMPVPSTTTVTADPSEGFGTLTSVPPQETKKEDPAPAEDKCAKVQCDDKVDCTQDTCNPLTGICQHQPVDVLCSEGQKCLASPEGNVAEPGCVECTKNEHCDDGDPCTFDHCGLTGKCYHDPIADCKACNFDNDCGVGGGGACDGKFSVGVRNRCVNNKCEWLVPYKYECATTCEDGHCMCGSVADCNDDGNSYTQDVCNISEGYPIGYCGINWNTAKIVEVGFGWEILVVTTTSEDGVKKFTSFGQQFEWNQGFWKDPVFTVRRKVGDSWKYALSGKCEDPQVDLKFFGNMMVNGQLLQVPGGFYECPTECIGKNDLNLDETTPVWMCSSKK